MIVMALDHVRDFYHWGAMQFQPDNLARATTLLFLTRWVTHICAPVFMFTAGLGAYFWQARGRTKGELSRFLWTRGLWLVVLELTVLRFALNFSLLSGAILLSVLWALGCSMIALALLVHLPPRVLAILSVAVILLHNLTDSVQATAFGRAAWVWNILHQQGVFFIAGVPAVSAYPLVPWIFVMAAGYCFGPIVMLDPARRRWWLARIGLAMTVAFVIIRGVNLYGDPSPWSSTVLSFLRTTKYPPSLDFLLMTLGPALLLMSWFDRLTLAKTNPLIVFGRVPLFYFLLHFSLAHLLTIPLALVRYGSADFLLYPPPSLGGPKDLFPPGYGYDLWVVYLMWILVVATCYPLCLWFARLKERRRDWWLSYL